MCLLGHARSPRTGLTAEYLEAPAFARNTYSWSSVPPSSRTFLRSAATLPPGLQQRFFCCCSHSTAVHIFQGESSPPTAAAPFCRGGGCPSPPVRSLPGCAIVLLPTRPFRHIIASQGDRHRLAVATQRVLGTSRKADVHQSTPAIGAHRPQCHGRRFGSAPTDYSKAGKDEAAREPGCRECVQSAGL